MMRTHYVYTAYDAEGRPLYVGCTGSPEARYRAHMSGKEDARGWFENFVVRWRVAGPYPKTVALAIERDRIKALQPVFNGLSRGNRIKGHRRLLANTYLATNGAVVIDAA